MASWVQSSIGVTLRFCVPWGAAYRTPWHTCRVDIFHNEHLQGELLLSTQVCLTAAGLFCSPRLFLLQSNFQNHIAGYPYFGTPFLNHDPVRRQFFQQTAALFLEDA